MSENKPKDEYGEIFFPDLSKIMTPSGKTIAFEEDDAHSFNEIIDKNDSKSRALKKKYKLQNYEDKFYDIFLTIRRKCSNEKDIALKKKYYNEVVEMEKTVSNKLEKQYVPKTNNLLKNIRLWLKLNKKLSEAKAEDSNKHVDAFGDDNVNIFSSKTRGEFISACSQRFEKIKENYKEEKNKEILQSYVNEAIHMKEELNKLPPQLKSKKQQKLQLLTAVDEWLKTVNTKRLARSKSVNMKNIKRERKLDEVKEVKNFSFFEKFNYEFEKLTKEFESAKDDDEKINCIIEVSKIGRKVDFIKDERQKEDLLKKIKEWLNKNKEIPSNKFEELKQKFESAKEENEKINYIIDVSRLLKNVDLIKDLPKEIEKWLEYAKKLMSAIMPEPKKYRFGKGKMFDDNHVSDLDSYYIPAMKSPDSNFVRYSIGPGRGLKSVEKLHQELKQMKKDQNKILEDKIKEQKLKLSEITKKLKENIEKLKKFKDRKICKGEFCCKYEDESESESEREWGNI